MAEAMADPRDVALQQACPCVSMPMFDPLPTLTCGQRMVLGRNGVFLQMRTPWLDCSTRVGQLAERLPLPYGLVHEPIGFDFGAIPIRLLERFIEGAREALPDEVAGALIYDERLRSLSLRVHAGLDVGRGHVHYRIDDLREGEVLAVDLHSHGLLHCLSGPLPKPSIDQQNLQIPEATSDKSRATTSSWGIGQ